VVCGSTSADGVGKIRVTVTNDSGDIALFVRLRLSAGANDTDVTPGDVERWVRHADAGGAADADRAVPERGPARGAAVGRAQRMERAAIEPGGRDLRLVWVSLKQASSHRSRRVQRPG
jgi:hypothetical protein